MIAGDSGSTAAPETSWYQGAPAGKYAPGGAVTGAASGPGGGGGAASGRGVPGAASACGCIPVPLSSGIMAASTEELSSPVAGSPVVLVISPVQPAATEAKKPS